MGNPELSRLLRRDRPGSGRRTTHCPEDDEVAAFAEGGLSGERRRALEDHVADCSFCLAQLGFLARTHHLEASGAVPAALLARASHGLGPRTAATGWAVRGIGATASVLAVAAVLWLADTRSESRRERAVAREPSIATLELVTPSEGQTVGVSAVEFAWRTVPGAAFYDFQLVTAEGDVVWSERLDATATVIPASIRLIPGATYYAWVRAHLESGTTLRSPAVGFRAGP